MYYFRNFGRKCLVMIAAVFLLIGPAQAVLIGQNDVTVAGPDSGDGFNITFDDVSGLQWLDLSVTSGMSRNQVQASSLITSGAYRFARDVEVDNLFATNIGISFGGSSAQTTPFNANAALVAAGQAFVNFFGVTNGQFPIGSFGLVDSATTLPGGFNTYSVRLTSPSNPTVQLFRLDRPDTLASSGGFAGFGSFLVKASDSSEIAEPGAFALFGAGLAMLLLVRRRRA